MTEEIEAQNASYCGELAAVKIIYPASGGMIFYCQAVNFLLAARTAVAVPRGSQAARFRC